MPSMTLYLLSNPTALLISSFPLSVECTRSISLVLSHQLWVAHHESGKKDVKNPKNPRASTHVSTPVALHPV